MNSMETLLTVFSVVFLIAVMGMGGGGGAGGGGGKKKGGKKKKK